MKFLRNCMKILRIHKRILRFLKRTRTRTFRTRTFRTRTVRTGEDSQDQVFLRFS